MAPERVDLARGQGLRSGLNRGQLEIVRGVIIAYATERGLTYNPSAVTIDSIDERIFEGLENYTIAPDTLSDLEKLGQKLAQDFEPKNGIPD